MISNFVFTLSCADRPGIVAAVTTELAALNANIAESNQFWDRETGQLFMRLAFTAPDGVGRETLERALRPSIERFGMRTELIDQARKKKILVMVSRFDHALLHLLYQIRVGWLDTEVAAIVSNHEDFRATAEYERIPFHLLPVRKDGKAEQEEQVLKLFQETGADLVVLARYMQILSDRFSTRLYGLVPALVQGRPPLPPGARARRQDHRRHRALRHPRARRGPDHRAGRGAGEPRHDPRRPDRGGPRHREPGAGSGGQAPPGKPGDAQRAQDGGVRVGLRAQLLSPAPGAGDGGSPHAARPASTSCATAGLKPESAP